MDSKKPIRVVQVGLGPLGKMLTPFLAERKGLQVVGAVDIDPKVMGNDLGEYSGCSDVQGIRITGDIVEAIGEGADVAAVTTVSSLQTFAPHVEDLARRKLNLVSTCEELSYPWKTQPELSTKLDRIAKENGISVLGTGVNPGFLMDCLPTMATAVCRKVQSIRIDRIQDASHRRLPFQEKIGARLTVEEFKKRADAGKIRHVGLVESMHMIAARMGWDLDEAKEQVEPAMGDNYVRGVDQQSWARVGTQEVIRLVFRAAIEEKHPHDRIHIEGTPSFDLTVPGGINGDIATCAMVTNAVPIIVEAPPGLHTMIDIPPVSYAP